MKEILEKLKVDFEYFTGGKYIGLVRAIGAGFASRLYEFSSKLNFIEKQAFIETADKDYLYLHAGHLLPPKGSEVAEGFVIFFGEIGATVPVGTNIKDDNGSFTTRLVGTVNRIEFRAVAAVSNGVVTLPANLEIPSCKCIANNVSVTAISSKTGFSFPSSNIKQGDIVTVQVDKTDAVLVTSDTSGNAGNRGFGDILKTKVTINGINKESGVLAISGGKDAENVEDYRKRVKFFMSNPQAPFNENNIKAMLLENIPTLKYAWVKGGEIEDGKVKVYIINSEYSLTQAESYLAKDLVTRIKPAQMKPEFIEINLPVIKTQNVLIKDLSPSNEEMKNEVRKNIEYLFDVDLFEKGIKREGIESMIYRTKRGLERVESFNVLEGECLSKPYTFWKLGSVKFQ